MPTNQELLRSLHLLNFLMHRKACTHAQAKNDSTRGQGQILAILKIEGSLSTRALSRFTGARVSSLNELLAKLERQDYIRRCPYPEDKRVIMNELTEKGKQAAPQPPALEIFDCLSPNEREVFYTCLNKLTAALEAQLDAPGTDIEAICRHRKDVLTKFLNQDATQAP